MRSTIYRNPANNNGVEVLQKDNYYLFGKQRIFSSSGNNRKSVAMSSFVPLKDKLLMQIISIFVLGKNPVREHEGN
ncbi:hypothetical protein [Sphingobacterium anhuiense]|uniref:Uncharacterized protein n=1 Tax=Sphingobacterium anhuiense TaxID=493780 RepID=A0ABW5YV98_9SPHI